MTRGIFFTIPARGHVNPALSLATALNRAGAEVTVFSSPEFETPIETSGVGFRAYEGPIINHFLSFASKRGRIGYLARTLAKSTSEIFEQEVERVRAERPDFILHDALAPWGKCLARAAGTPAICMSAMLAPTRRTREIALRSGYRMGGPGEIGTAIWHAWAAAATSARFSIRSRQKYTGLTGLFAAYEDFNVVCTSREFQPGGESLDDSWFFAGPALEEEASSSEDEPIICPEGLPLVIVSAGTVFSTDLTYFHATLEALSGIAAFVVVSSGGAFDPETLGETPENVLVRRNIPFIELLGKAWLFVGHGGIGSLSKAFATGVPAVIVPQVLEQTVTGRRAEELGGAICVLRHKLTPERLRAAVERILGDGSYSANAAKIGETFRSAPGMDEAAERILDYARTERADRS